MNKKLMAVAVAGALTAPGLAVAQIGGTAGVSLYGRLDTAVMIQKFSNEGTGTVPDLKKNDIFSPGNALGVRGREDLGGGTAAWFQLEAGAWPDGRLDPILVAGAERRAVQARNGIGQLSICGQSTYVERRSEAQILFRQRDLCARPLGARGGL